MTSHLLHDSLPHLLRRFARLQVHPEDIDRIVLVIANEGSPVDEDGAKLVGKIADDAEHREAKGPVGSIELERIAYVKLRKSRKVVRDNDAFSRSRLPMHGRGITGDHVTVNALSYSVQFHRDDHQR